MINKNKSKHSFDVLTNNAEILWFNCDDILATDDLIILYVIPRKHIFKRMLNWMLDPHGKKVEKAIIHTFNLMLERLQAGIQDYIEEHRDEHDYSLKKHHPKFKSSYTKKNQKGKNVEINIWLIAHPEIASKVTCHHLYFNNKIIEDAAVKLKYEVLKQKYPLITNSFNTFTI